MSAKIIIHIGYPRTGSQFLHHMVFNKLENTVFKNRLTIDSEIVDDKVNIFGERILSGRPYMLSPAKERIPRLKNVSKMFPDAKIILITRNKDTWLKSLHGQYIRNGGIKSFKDFCLVFDDEYFNNIKFVRLLNNLFPFVHVNTYEKFRENPRGYIKDICNFIGVKTPSYNNKIVNPRPNQFQMKGRLLLNKYFKSEVNLDGILPHFLYDLLFKHFY